MKYLCISIFFFISIFGQTIHVVTENWVPYNYIDNNIIKGIGTEIVKIIFADAKINYDIKL